MEVNVVNDLDPSASDGSVRTVNDGFESLIINAMRPEFRLGSLYNRRRDCLVPSVSLWKEDTLRKHVSKRPTPNQQWTIDSENSISSKIKKLDIEASLALSLFGGMIDIKGHAEYLKDEKQSSDVAKVSLTYRETTDYHELTQEAIKYLDYRDVLTDNKIMFTHVVVGIQYGGTCTMVFEREVKVNEEKEKVSGSLSVVLKAIPITGSAKLDLDEEIKKNTDNFTCKVYSDIKLNHSVVSWDEAIALYKLLPTKLSSSVKVDNNDEDLSGTTKGVPVKVWLLPKQVFGCSEDSFVKEISEGTSALPLGIIESLNNVTNLANDLSNKAKKFPILQENLKRFQTSTESYLITFKKDTLSALLLKIRGGVENEDSLLQAVEAHNKSPFGSTSLEAWLFNIEKEISILNGYEEVLCASNIKFLLSHQIDREIVKHDICIVLNLSLLRKKDELLENLGQFLKDRNCDDEKINESEGRWITNRNLLEVTRKRVHEFKAFAKANQHNAEMIFLVNVMELDETKDANTFIEVYNKGVKNEAEHFQPPSQVQEFKIDSYSQSDACFSWLKPNEGSNHVSAYKIKVEPLVDVDNEKKGSQSTTTNAQVYDVSCEKQSFSLQELKCSTPYVVNMFACCLSGVGCSETTSVTFTTLPSSPPSDITTKVLNINTINVSWSKPNLVAENAVLENYEIEHKSNKDSCKISSVGNAQERLFEGLLYDTEYQFRFKAVYDIGSSLWSSEIVQRTNAMPVPQLIKATMKGSEVDLKWNSNIEGENVYNLRYCVENDDEWSVIQLKNVCRNDVNNEKRAEVKLECGINDRYKFCVQVKNDCGESNWSEVLTARNSKLLLLLLK